ncbi:MAG: DUF523 domain-containing protein [Clostridia bacterium]|nr:DUF523 domain-containing protein [Clostridia bacterium]
MSKPRILVSACLLGVNCRYNGTGGELEGLHELMELAELVPVCPEILGGLPTPRPPAERQDGRVITCEGGDVTEAYARGAEESLHLAQLFGAKLALMKERSPSCGAGEIYDGTFTHTRIPGDGTASALLKANGIEVYGEMRIHELIERLKKEN